MLTPHDPCRVLSRVMPGNKIVPVQVAATLGRQSVDLEGVDDDAFDGEEAEDSLPSLQDTPKKRRLLLSDTRRKTSMMDFKLNPAVAVGTLRFYRQCKKDRALRNIRSCSYGDLLESMQHLLAYASVVWNVILHLLVVVLIVYGTCLHLHLCLSLSSNCPFKDVGGLHVALHPHCRPVLCG